MSLNIGHLVCIKKSFDLSLKTIHLVLTGKKIQILSLSSFLRNGILRLTVLINFFLISISQNSLHLEILNLYKNHFKNSRTIHQNYRKSKKTKNTLFNNNTKNKK